MSAAQSIEEETSVFKKKKSKHFIVYMFQTKEIKTFYSLYEKCVTVVSDRWIYSYQ